MGSGTCADLTMFSGTQRQSRSNSPHYSSLAHTHPAALPSLPCLPTCLFSHVDTDSWSSRQRRSSKETPGGWAAHSHPNNQRTPGLAVRCKPESWHQAMGILSRCCGKVQLTSQRSSSYFQLLVPVSWNLKSVLPAEDV